MTDTRTAVKDRVTSVLAEHFPGGNGLVASVTNGAAVIVTTGRDKARLQQYAATLREAGFIVSDKSERGQLYVREPGPEHDIQMAREVAAICARGYNEHIRQHGPDGDPPAEIFTGVIGGVLLVTREGVEYLVTVTPRHK